MTNEQKRQWYVKNKKRVAMRVKTRRDTTPALRANQKEYDHQYHVKNKERLATQHHDRYAKDRVNIAARRRERRHGLPTDGFNQKLLEQKNCCALCHKPFGDTAALRPNVDHSHALNLNRGLLHRTCNVWLHVLENKTYREQGDAYLKLWEERHKNEQTRKVESAGSSGESSG